MSILTQKLANASKQFQSHNFRKALELYVDCLHFCQKTDESPNVISNIMSSKGALECILGQYDEALATLNAVIKKDPTHFLCLMRRSQVYKKKNMLKKALKDLEAIHIFCPDNFQVSALKVQIQNMILKSKQNLSSDDSEEDESVDETESLNFANLKQIDRKSVTLSGSESSKQRKSRVTILGDSTIEYNRTQPQDNGQNEVQDFLLSHAQTHKKYLETQKQIEIDNEQDNSEEKTGNLLVVPTIKVNKGNKKSILKNKNTSFFIDNQDLESRKSNYLGRQSKIIDLLKNIEGKVIKAPITEKIDRSSREVQFKKSSCKEQDYIISVTSTNNQTTFQKIQGRKSCLKRSSFEGPLIVTSGPRRSKFQALAKGQVDGHIVRNHRKSIESSQSGKNDQDSDEGSEHNIFGSKQMVLSNQVRMNLGLGDDEEKDEIILMKEPKIRSTGGKSILKKNSSFMMMTPNKVCSKENIKSRDGSEDGRKQKKSVMFSRTQ